MTTRSGGDDERGFGFELVDGVLYLGGPAGLVELRATAAVLLTAPSELGGGVGALVADPSQHRLLAASTGDRRRCALCEPARRRCSTAPHCR